MGRVLLSGGLCIGRGWGRFLAGWSGTEEWRKYHAGFPAQVAVYLVIIVHPGNSNKFYLRFIVQK
jgi:hypothetical protein